MNQRMFACGLVLGLLMLGAVSEAGSRKPKLPFDIKIRTKKTTGSESVEKNKYGGGKEKVSKVTYSAVLKNTQFRKTFEHLSITLHVIAESYAWKSDQEQHKVLKSLKKKGLNLGENEQKEINLGVVEFKKFQSSTGTVMWRGGWKPKGYVIELYQDGELIGFKQTGGTKAGKAYEAYVKSRKKKRKK